MIATEIYTTETSEISPVSTLSLPVQPQHSLLTRLNDSRGGDPLICFHPIEGSFGSYRKLIKRLPKEVAAFGVKQVEMASGVDVLEQLVDQYADAICECSHGKPCRLFGHSFGAFLAMKVAKALEKRHQPVEYVAVVDWVPFTVDDFSTKRTVLADYFVTLHRYLVPRLSMLIDLPQDQLQSLALDYARYLLDMNDLPTLSEISRRYCQLGLTDPVTRPETIEPILRPLYDRLPLMRDSGLEIVSAPLKVWRATEGLARNEQSWSNWTLGTCQQHMLPGNHMTVMQNPAVQTLARQLCSSPAFSPCQMCRRCVGGPCSRKASLVA